jgi:Reverse transcriptase (RNA-dependent DNA polymerase)
VVDEMKSLSDLAVWSYVEVSPFHAKKAIPLKWVFKVKYKERGAIERFLARLNPRGSSKSMGIDYSVVFAPVPKYSTLRFLVSQAGMNVLKYVKGTTIFGFFGIRRKTVL